MYSSQRSLYGFKKTLFDILIGPEDGDQTMTLHALRQSVAQDLEELLNSRMIKLDPMIKNHPLAQNSIIQFGIIDFVGLSTANPLDRDTICNSIANTIASHEPRLRQIKVQMRFDHAQPSALSLSIHAYLNIHPVYESIVFDALLKATTQQYLVAPRS